MDWTEAGHREWELFPRDRENSRRPIPPQCVRFLPAVTSLTLAWTGARMGDTAQTIDSGVDAEDRAAGDRT